MTRHRIVVGSASAPRVGARDVGAADGTGAGAACEPCTTSTRTPTPDGWPQTRSREGQSRWSPRIAGRADNQRRLQALLEDAAARRDAAAGSAERLAGDLYASCMDEARVDAAGATPLAPLLAEIDAVRTPADVSAPSAGCTRSAWRSGSRPPAPTPIAIRRASS